MRPPRLSIRRLFAVAAIGGGLALAGVGIYAAREQSPACHTYRGKAQPLKGDAVTGRAQVHDGDTLRLRYCGRQVSMRIQGIDAPELKQTCSKGGVKVDCGIIARDRLAALVAQTDITCTVMATDKYKRPVATCLANGQDVARTLVREGLAWEYKKFSGGAYSADEEYAASRGLGLWGMESDMPEHYRACTLPRGKRPRPKDC